MSRPREFGEEDVRQAILGLFWQQGYSATSLADLEGATGLVRTSLYNAFGNKAEMFAQAMARYHEMIGTLLREATANRGVDGLADVFGELMLKSDATADWPAGCLMVGAATQSATREDRHIGIVRDYRRMLVASVRAVLYRELAAGRLRRDLDPGGAAGFLVCLVWGALAAQCIDTEPDGARDSLDILHKTLAGWRS